jgi:DNA-binding CsgD family transcriptional regulator
MMTTMVEGVLLERDAELAVLEQATDAAGDRRGSVLLVSGEAGIGKTALLDAFAARLHEARAGRARVHRGACDDLLTPRPFGPIRDIARTSPRPARTRLDMRRASSELQRLGPVAAAWGEHAWSNDEPQPALDRLAQVQLVAEERASQRYAEQLGYWRWKLGEPVQLTSDSGWALQVRGEWDRAARWWAQRGQPYEHALALAGSGAMGPTIEALRMREDLGAVPAARKARARLRDLGARGVPRGPTSATRANPAGLTPRQTEVLELLATGLTNAQIADHLVVSLRTVDHHVSAILQKLGVGSRQEAAARSEEVLSP